MGFFKTFKAFWVFPVIGLILIVFGGVTSIIGSQIDAQHHADLATVETTRATITGCRPYSVRGNNGGYTTLSSLVWLSYTFTYNDKTYSHEDAYPTQCDSALVKDKETLDIKFVPSDPTLSGFSTDTFLASAGPRPLSIGALVFGAILVIFPLQMWWWTRSFRGTNR